MLCFWYQFENLFIVGTRGVLGSGGVFSPSVNGFSFNAGSESFFNSDSYLEVLFLRFSSAEFRYLILRAVLFWNIGLMICIGEDFGNDGGKAFSACHILSLIHI